ncbi:hypothetical protein A45J_0743 [hot springs metagenome]|uniref:DNA methylase adenine-specific domain-containing protein n=1 Tax=hot springs metagenome TaxID=433727 RepID=A0A5J4L146_9ZZZZ
MGHLIDRTHKELSDEEIKKIADTYHAWKSNKSNYADVPGFCKSAAIEEIRANGYALTPGRYVGAEITEDEDEHFEEKMKRLTARLEEQFKESARLEKAIKNNLRKLGL